MDINGGTSRLPSSFKNFQSSLSYLIRDTENNLAQGVYGSTDALAAAQPYAQAPHDAPVRAHHHGRSSSAFVPASHHQQQQQQLHSHRPAHGRAPSSPPLSSLDAQERSRSVSPSLPPPPPRPAFAFAPPPSMPYPGAAGAATGTGAVAPALSPLPHGSAIPAFSAHAHLSDSLAQVASMAHENAQQVAALYTTLAGFKTKMRAAFDSNMHTLDKKVRLVRRDILGHISQSIQELEQRMLAHLRDGVLAATAAAAANQAAAAQQQQQHSPHEAAMDAEFRRHATEELLFLKGELGKLHSSLASLASESERRVRAAENVAQTGISQSRMLEASVGDLHAAQSASEKEVGLLRSELEGLVKKNRREERTNHAEGVARATEQSRSITELKHVVDNLVRQSTLASEQDAATQSALLAHVNSAAQAYIDEQGLVTAAMVKGIRRQMALQQEELERLRAAVARQAQPSKRGMLLLGSGSGSGSHSASASLGSMGSFASSSAAAASAMGSSHAAAATAAAEDDSDADDAAIFAKLLSNLRDRVESLEMESRLTRTLAGEQGAQVDQVRIRLVASENESRTALAQLSRTVREEQSRMERDAAAREQHARTWREEMNAWSRNMESSVHQMKFQMHHSSGGGIGLGGGVGANSGISVGAGADGGGDPNVESKIAALEAEVRHLASLVGRPTASVPVAPATPVRADDRSASASTSASSHWDLSSQILALEQGQTQLQTQHFQLEARVSSSAAETGARVDHLSSKVAQLMGGGGAVGIVSPTAATSAPFADQTSSSAATAAVATAAVTAERVATAACARLNDSLRTELSRLDSERTNHESRIVGLEGATAALGLQAERQGAVVQELQRAQHDATGAAIATAATVAPTVPAPTHKSSSGPLLPRTIPAPSPSSELAAAAAAARALDLSPVSQQPHQQQAQQMQHHRGDVERVPDSPLHVTSAPNAAAVAATRAGMTTASAHDYPLSTLPESVRGQIDAHHSSSQHLQDGPAPSPSASSGPKLSKPAVPSTIRAPPAGVLAAAGAGAGAGLRPAPMWQAQPLEDNEDSEEQDGAAVARGNTSGAQHASSSRASAPMLGVAAAAALPSVLAAHPSLRQPHSSAPTTTTTPNKPAAGAGAGAGTGAGVVSSLSPSGGLPPRPRSRSNTPRSMSPVSSGANTPTASSAAAAAALQAAQLRAASSASSVVSPSAASRFASPTSASSARTNAVSQQQQQHQQQQQAQTQSQSALAISDDDESSSSSESDSDSEDETDSSQSSSSLGATGEAPLSPAPAALSGPLPSASPDLSATHSSQRSSSAAADRHQRGEMSIPAEVAAHVARGPSDSAAAEAAAAAAASVSPTAAGAAAPLPSPNDDESDEDDEEADSPPRATPRSLDLMAQAVKRRYQELERRGQVDGTAPLDEDSLYDPADDSAQGSAPHSRRGTVMAQQAAALSSAAATAATAAAAASAAAALAVDPHADPASSLDSAPPTTLVSPTAPAIPLSGAPKLHMMAPLDLSEASASASASAYDDRDDDDGDGSSGNDSSRAALLLSTSPLASAISPKPKLSAREQKFQALMARHQKLTSYKRVVTPPSTRPPSQDDAAVPVATTSSTAAAKEKPPSVQRAASVGGVSMGSLGLGGGGGAQRRSGSTGGGRLGGGRGTGIGAHSYDEDSDSDLDLSSSPTGHTVPSLHMRGMGHSPSSSPSPSPSPANLARDPELDYTEMDEEEEEDQSLHSKFREQQAAKLKAQRQQQLQQRQQWRGEQQAAAAAAAEGGVGAPSPVSPATEYARVHLALQKQQQTAQTGSQQWASDDSEEDEFVESTDREPDSGTDMRPSDSPPAPAPAVVAAVGGLKLLAPFITSSLGGGGGELPLGSKPPLGSVLPKPKGNLGVTMPNINRGAAVGGMPDVPTSAGFLKAPLGAPKAAASSSLSSAAPASSSARAPLHPSSSSLRSAAAATAAAAGDEDDEFDFEDDEPRDHDDHAAASSAAAGRNQQASPDLHPDEEEEEEDSADLQSSLSTDYRRLDVQAAQQVRGSAQSQSQGQRGQYQQQQRQRYDAEEDVEISEDESLSSPHADEFADESHSHSPRHAHGRDRRPGQLQGQSRSALPQLQQPRRSPLGSVPVHMGGGSGDDEDHIGPDDIDEEGLDSLFETTNLSPAASPAAKHAGRAGPLAQLGPGSALGSDLSAGHRRRGQPHESAGDADDLDADDLDPQGGGGVGGSLMSELDSMDISASGADFTNSF